MKRSLAIITLTSIFLSTAAFAQSAGEQTGVNSALGIAPKTARLRPDQFEVHDAGLAPSRRKATVLVQAFGHTVCF
jgi:hypothetical protein